ncbi:MAG: Enoyl-CoA hydratase/isomerase [Polaromonas sp.]|nr:Enoyl-CoA hydratase/isomerase [Polaromonas sp.]
MSGKVLLEISGSRVRITLHQPRKFNAMSREMWRDLRIAFEGVQRRSDIHCVLIRGEVGNFCAGGDISQYADFRFDEVSLREFHENEVWGALQAMLDCDVPIVAQLEGSCMGAGLEIASCCDIRIAAHTARFGIPTGKLGFPMAPREAALMLRTVGEVTAREMLLSGTVHDADTMLQRGFLAQVVPAAQIRAAALERIRCISQLAPQAARRNKATLRVLAQTVPAQLATKLVASAYGYAPSAEHREGIAAFMQKRPAQFVASLPVS